MCQSAWLSDWRALWRNFMAGRLTVRRPTIHCIQPQSSDQLHADHEARLAELRSRTSARSSSLAWSLSPSCSSSPGSCHQRAPEPTTRPMKRQQKSAIRQRRRGCFVPSSRANLCDAQHCPPPRLPGASRQCHRLLRFHARVPRRGTELGFAGNGC